MTTRLIPQMWYTDEAEEAAQAAEASEAARG